ncbi:MAG TPA: hypothetical protein ENN80_15285, partial [Candidatus Hydrogenedentes bacterium]|nr:hypothetical protein [Candidatus Hydrogenedentota bacterium]
MTHTTRRSAALVLALLALAAPAFTDTIYFRAAEEEPGRLVKMTAKTVVFEGLDGIKEYDKA